MHRNTTLALNESCDMIYSLLNYTDGAQMAVDPTVELGVMQGVADNLKKLEGDQPATQRVLEWAVSAFLPSGLHGAIVHSVSTVVTPPAGAVALVGQQPRVVQSDAWETLLAFYSAASP